MDYVCGRVVDGMRTAAVHAFANNEYADATAKSIPAFVIWHNICFNAK